MTFHPCKPNANCLPTLFFPAHIPECSTLLKGQLPKPVQITLHLDFHRVSTSLLPTQELIFPPTILKEELAFTFPKLVPPTLLDSILSCLFCAPLHPHLLSLRIHNSKGPPTLSLGQAQLPLSIGKARLSSPFQSNRARQTTSEKGQVINFAGCADHRPSVLYYCSSLFFHSSLKCNKRC